MTNLFDERLGKAWKDETGIDPERAFSASFLPMIEIIGEIAMGVLTNCRDRIQRKSKYPPEPPDEAEQLKRTAALIQRNKKIRRSFRHRVWDDLERKYGQGFANRHWITTSNSMLKAMENTTVDEIAAELSDTPKEEDLPWSIPSDE